MDIMIRQPDARQRPSQDADGRHKTLLITGGAGFIGSNFARHIFEKYPNYSIIIYDALTYAGSVENLSESLRQSDRFTFVYANICSASQVAATIGNVDVVVHFAAETHVTRSIFDASDFWQTDIVGTANLLGAISQASHHIERFIHVSTSEVYGSCRGDRETMDEEHPLEPRSPYASAKTGADRIVYSYWQTYGLPAVIVRPFNNYGPFQHLEKAIPRFITSALLDEPLTVHGDGKSSRDWVYVDDTCSAIDLLIHAPLDLVIGQVFNIATNVDTPILNIARMILRILGKPEHFIERVGERPGQVIKHRGDYTKIAHSVGWRPEINLEQGLERTVQWYRDHPAFWSRLLWMRKIKINTGTTSEWH